jgi:hypothetical protein
MDALKFAEPGFMIGDLLRKETPLIAIFGGGRYSIIIARLDGYFESTATIDILLEIGAERPTIMAWNKCVVESA